MNEETNSPETPLVADPNQLESEVEVFERLMRRLLERTGQGGVHAGNANLDEGEPGK